MGQSLDHALGLQEAVFINEESTFGTFAKPAATDALKVLTKSFTPNVNRIDREDKRTTRSILERITGKQENAWSLETYLIPSGTASTPPDDGPLWKLLLGTEAIASDVQYTPSSAQALGSLTICGEANDVFSESVFGAWVDKATISINGGDPPRVSWEGGAASYITTGTALVSGNHTAPDTTIDLQAQDLSTGYGPLNIKVGSVVAFGSEDNSGAGYEVTANDGSTITITPTLAGNISDGDQVKPFTPSQTTAGSPANGVTGTWLIDDQAFPLLSATIEISNSIKPVNDEAGQAKATDYIALTRMITGSVSVRLRRDQVIWLGRRDGYATRDLDLTVGDTAGARFRFELPTVEIEWSAVEVPQIEEATVQIPFKALGSSGDDEITIYHF